jgi:hypothetical protein
MENKMENRGTVHGPILAQGCSPRGLVACAAWQLSHLKISDFEM